MSIFLNGFRIELSAQTFTAYSKVMPDNKNLRSIKDNYQNEWFLYWHEGLLYGIPRTPNPQIIIGEPIELFCNQHFKLLVARINDLLPQILNEYPAFQINPFKFLAQKQELVSQIIPKLNLGVLSQTEILKNFKIIPKYTLEPRLIELRPQEVFIGLFLRLGTTWQITASLSELQQKGINLNGLYVVHSQFKKGERRLVGKIGSLTNKTLHLSQAYNELTEIAEDSVLLEGSKASFAHCLKVLLGNKYNDFERLREIEQGELLIGKGQDVALN
jgi:hypothetical protein